MIIDFQWSLDDWMYAFEYLFNLFEVFYAKMSEFFAGLSENADNE